MRGVSVRISSLVLAAALAFAGLARAADLGDQLAATTEKLNLEGRKGPSLLRPGFAVGEYTGSAKAKMSSSSGLGSFSKDKSQVAFTVSAPNLGEVSAECRGGQGRIGLGWITFKRTDYAYVCTYGGAAPAGAELDIAESEGKAGLGRLIQPQRAGELGYGRVVLRAETRYLGGIPLGGGAPISYAIFRQDGTVVAGLMLNGFRPVFLLPRTPGPERDAAAVLALSLYFSGDPGKRN